MPDSLRAFRCVAAAVAVIAATTAGCATPDIATVATTVAPVPGSDAGADQSIRDGSGRTALFHAERLGQLQVAAILRSR